MRLAVALTIFAVGYAPTVFAQPADWVIVPVSTTEDIAWMQPTVETMGAALSKQGASVLSAERAVILYEERGSGPPKKVTETQIQRLDALMKEALRLIVVQEHSRALEVLRLAQKLIDEAIAELNRTKTRAENVLDTCLYMVRALYDTGDPTRAEQQARQCVRLVPGGEANPGKHPPEVIELYEEASRPGPERTGSVAVNSQPQGCDVRINGLRLGQTPFTMTDLYPGDYQVQVECEPGLRGRVHQVAIGTGTTKVFVDAVRERALRTDPVLGLSYSDQDEAERRFRDAQAIAEVLQVRVVMVASSPTTNTLELRVIDSEDPKRVLLARQARVDCPSWIRRCDLLELEDGEGIGEVFLQANDRERSCSSGGASAAIAKPASEAQGFETRSPTELAATAARFPWTARRILSCKRMRRSATAS